MSPLLATFCWWETAHGQSDGGIVGWGMQVIVEQSALEGCVGVGAGAYHSLGLKPDGRIVAWGYNEEGQCNVPEPNADFAAVAGGQAHSVALRSDGTIAAWGANWAGQCDIPSPNAGFVAI